jgi:hypothetical protein
METIKISKVSVLNDGRLAVYPAAISPLYEYIYRAAAGVHWNKDLACFQSTPPQEWDHRKWFLQIISVVHSELGIRLDLMPYTEFTGLETEFKTEIINANAEIQRKIILN